MRFSKSRALSCTRPLPRLKGGNRWYKYTNLSFKACIQYVRHQRWYISLSVMSHKILHGNLEIHRAYPASNRSNLVQQVLFYQKHSNNAQSLRLLLNLVVKHVYLRFINITHNKTSNKHAKARHKMYSCNRHLQVTSPFWSILHSLLGQYPHDVHTLMSFPWARSLARGGNWTLNIWDPSPLGPPIIEIYRSVLFWGWGRTMVMELASLWTAHLPSLK